jgi:hypothetical protein
MCSGRVIAGGQMKAAKKKRRTIKSGHWVGEEDLKTLLYCSMRYSLGRMTYMPGLVQGLIRSHIAVLKAHDCDQLGREINEYYQERGEIGMDFDTRDWLAFRDWLFALRDEMNSAEAAKL